MAFTGSNDFITKRKAMPTPAGSESVTVRMPLAMATGDLALNTIGQVGWLPAGTVPVDVRIGGTDMDSGAAAMVLQVGIWDGSGASLSTASADGGAHWGVTTAANAAFDQAVTRNGTAMLTVSPSTSDRRLGVKVGTAPTTAVAGTLYVELTYRNELST